MTYFETHLKQLKEHGLYREPIAFSSYQGPKVIHHQKTYILMGSNHYLGLNHDPRINQAAKEALDTYGTGSGGSRLTTGSTLLHEQLEKRIAQFKRTEAALVFNTGYMTNLGVISGICDKQWTLLCDKLNHASIVDGWQLSNAICYRYKHRDMEDLEKQLKRSNTPHKMIVTDGVFSMDGTLAPLPDIVALAEAYNAMICVDDAHGVGVIGPTGNGTAAFFNVSSKIDLQIGTLSKAIPSIGGYVAGSKAVIDYLRNVSRSFIFSTSLPPASMAAALKAIDIIEKDPERRSRLLAKTKAFKSQLIHMGYRLTDTETPILPILIGDPVKAANLSQCLLADGIYIPAIRPPSVPRGTSRLRISMMATHDDCDLAYVLQRLKVHGTRLKILGDVQ